MSAIVAWDNLGPGASVRLRREAVPVRPREPRRTRRSRSRRSACRPTTASRRSPYTSDPDPLAKSQASLAYSRGGRRHRRADHPRRHALRVQLHPERRLRRNAARRRQVAWYTTAWFDKYVKRRRERRQAAADDALADRRARGRDRPEPRRQHVLVLLPRRGSTSGWPAAAGSSARTCAAGCAGMSSERRLDRRLLVPGRRDLAGRVMRQAAFDGMRLAPLIHSPRAVSPSCVEEESMRSGEQGSPFRVCRRSPSRWRSLSPRQRPERRASRGSRASTIRRRRTRSTRSACSRRDRRLPERSWSSCPGRRPAPPISSRSRRTSSAGRRTGRCGRSSAGRTSSRTTRWPTG